MLLERRLGRGGDRVEGGHPRGGVEARHEGVQHGYQGLRARREMGVGVVPSERAEIRLRNCAGGMGGRAGGAGRAVFFAINVIRKGIPVNHRAFGGGGGGNGDGHYSYFKHIQFLRKKTNDF